ncbi:MAG: hypothetical protein ABIO19_17700 [Burkholderiaceae bacterium]
MRLLAGAAVRLLEPEIATGLGFPLLGVCGNALWPDAKNILSSVFLLTHIKYAGITIFFMILPHF